MTVGRDGRALQLLPLRAPSATTGKASSDGGLPFITPELSLAMSSLPDPDFDFSPLLSVLPDAQVVVGDGIYQYNEVLQVELTQDPALSAGKAGSTAETPLHFRMTAIVGPDGCFFKGKSCPHTEPIRPGAVADTIVDELTSIVAAGKVTKDSNSLSDSQAAVEQ